MNKYVLTSLSIALDVIRQPRLDTKLGIDEYLYPTVGHGCYYLNMSQFRYWLSLSLSLIEAGVFFYYLDARIGHNIHQL